jgi:4-amino-4-deoxy-L-arabinose transferase-like glycosyltransferase
MQRKFITKFFINDYKILFLIFTLAFILRALPILYLEYNEKGWHEKNINEIEFYYDDVARSLLAGKGFVHSVNPNEHTKYKFDPGTPFHFVPPLYAWFIYGIYKTFGPNVLLGKIFTVALDSLTCALIFLISQKIFKERVISYLGGLLYAIYPLSIATAMTLYYQVPMNILICLLVFFLMNTTNLKNGVLSGVAWGLSTLAKPVTLPLLLILPAFKIIESKFKKTRLQDSLIWSSAFFIIGISVITPWTVRNFIVFNEFVPVQRGGPEAFFQGSLKKYIELDVDTLRLRYKDEFEIDDLLSQGIRNHVMSLRDSPLSYAHFLAKKFAYAWYNTEGKEKNFNALLVQTPFLFLAILGLITGSRNWIKSNNNYILFIILFIMGIQVAIFPLVRYTLVVMPLMMVYSSFGLFYLINIRRGHQVLVSYFK